MGRNWFSWCTTNTKDDYHEHLLEDVSNSNSRQKQKTSEQQQQQKPLDTDRFNLYKAIKNRLCGTERPFHVVLIDLKIAAKYRKIHCVEKPLSDEGLKFVAISYRWGEVQETTVDTGVGYMATITSFDVSDFFDLCKMIIQEVDLQSMDYVWVDAICVNQTNHQQRKATIYHMTDIYEHAKYILAVPDLHLAYLGKASTTNRQSIYFSNLHCKYIYRLLQGENMQRLFDYDQKWLDEINVPKEDQRLRDLLTTYTEHFTTGLMTCRKHHWIYDKKTAFDHICGTRHSVTTTATTTSVVTNCTPYLWSVDDEYYSYGITGDGAVVTDKVPLADDDTFATIQNLHTCNTTDIHACPLYWFCDDRDDYGNGKGRDDQEWKQRIPKRSQEIRQSMLFLLDLVLDWSTRVWVVSEFHIAKNKSNKIKYWFIQLQKNLSNPFPAPASKACLTFDFNKAPFWTCDDQHLNLCHVTGETNHTSDAVYQTFHATMRQHLSQQTFFEKMLKSNASRHEDRFHAILPSSEYKSILNDKDRVDHWHNIHTLTSVKLELYKWMNTKDKLELLFLSGTATNMCKVIPTFATTTIAWPDPGNYPPWTVMDDPTFPGNFDLADPSTIQLIQHRHRSTSSYHYKLNIKPREYYKLLNKYLCARSYASNIMFPKFLGLNRTTLTITTTEEEEEEDGYDVIVIPMFSREAMKDYYNDKKRMNIKGLVIVLIGCMTRNKWVLIDLDKYVDYSFSDMIQKYPFGEYWDIFDSDQHSPGFDIY